MCQIYKHFCLKIIFYLNSKLEESWPARPDESVVSHTVKVRSSC